MQGVDLPEGSEPVTAGLDRPPEILAPGIRSVDGLRVHLQWAIELEHATIPPYLTALYSIDPERNAEVADVVHSVVLEEMMHLAVAANLLNAIGGEPVIDHPRLLPPFPRSLPHGDPSLDVSLLSFGREALELFMRMERPSAIDDPPESDCYETIGQFYEAIRLGLLHLCTTLGEDLVFTGDPDRQIVDRQFRGGPGRLVAITGLDTALDALAQIVEQGEGAAHIEVWDGDCNMFHPERYEVGHYYRFRELEAGRRHRRGDTPATGPTGELLVVDWDACHRMRPNPRSADHDPGTPVRDAMDEFNRIYCTVLGLLEETFNGQPQLLGKAIGTMFRLKRQAEALMAMPLADGSGTAGPSFEYVPPADRA